MLRRLVGQSGDGRYSSIALGEFFLFDHFLVIASFNYAPMPPGGCLGCIGILLAPFVIIAIAARSLWSEDPLTWWAIGIVLAFASYVAYFMVSFGIPAPNAHDPVLIFVWSLMGWGAILFSPVILIREGRKRGWDDFLLKGLKRILPGRKHKRKRRDGKPRPPEEHDQED